MFKIRFYVGFEDISSGKKVTHYAQYRTPGYTTDKKKAHQYCQAHSAKLSNDIFDSLENQPLKRAIWEPIDDSGNIFVSKEWSF